MIISDSVEVFRDRAYTIVEVIDGNIVCNNYETNNIDNTIDFIKALDRAKEKNAVCLASCYETYVGSHNVLVNMQAQRDRVYEWACNKYKTFSQKYQERA